MAAEPSRGATSTPAQVLREVRLGLVLNGGVSLAVWMGGVTHEIDCMRRAHAATNFDPEDEPTTALYHELLGKLQERVLVDVVAGASAGGINGVLLASAIYAETQLPPLRDVWIAVGDFSKLLRSPSKREPPSILRGDDYSLPQLVRHFTKILGQAGDGPADQPIYLYVTATDFYGVEAVFADSTGRRFQELDHRRVFQFQHPAPDLVGAEEEEVVEAQEMGEGGPAEPGVMPLVAGFNRTDAASLLARAARSSSSFPVAFEAHGMRFEDEDVRRWLIDGGVLDNQPFNPILNRIAMIPAGDFPVKRVVGYVVPYVTEPSPERTEEAGEEGACENRPPRPTAKATADAANKLPRDLPKLNSLKRVVRELGEARRAEWARNRFDDDLNDDQLSVAGERLFSAYRNTRYAECLETFTHWAEEGFRAGVGEIGQLETVDPRQALEAPVELEKPPPAPDGLLWVPDGREWVPDESWRWGLAPSERIAAEALARLRMLLFDAPTDAVVRAAKEHATRLVAEIRVMKFGLCVYFQDETEGAIPVRAQQAYGAVVGDEPGNVDALSTRFEYLAHLLAAVDRPQLHLQRLINAEVVKNAFGVYQYAVPPRFQFLHMSAGVRNSLGHPAHSPNEKLAGMKLGHFGGFLKRSWRANDWLWGRLDGVEYLVAAVLDLDHLGTVGLHGGGVAALADDLSGLAFPDGLRDILRKPWLWTLNYARRDADEEVRAVMDITLGGVPEPDSAAQFRALLAAAADTDTGYPRKVRLVLLDCCRAALVARIQLEILDQELGQVKEAIERDIELGASRGSSGADWVAGGTGSTPGERVERFHDLTIGTDEQPVDEASSKLGLDVVSTAAAVTASAFSGSHAGLPVAVRAPLATLRGLTLVLNIITRLLVRTPAVGVALMIAAGVALVWGLVAPTVLLGAALPGLAALVIGGAAVLLTMVTSPLEARLPSFRQGVRIAILIAVPLVLVLLIGLPFGSRDVFDGFRLSEWLVEEAGSTAVDLAACFTLAALISALIRTVGRKLSRKARLVDLWIYRWSLVLGAASVAAGVTVERALDQECGAGETGWACVAESSRGAILFLILFGAISLAPLLAEIAAGGRWLFQRVIPPGWDEDGDDYLSWMLIGFGLVAAGLIGWALGQFNLIYP